MSSPSTTSMDGSEGSGGGGYGSGAEILSYLDADYDSAEAAAPLGLSAAQAEWAATQFTSLEQR